LQLLAGCLLLPRCFLSAAAKLIADEPVHTGKRGVKALDPVLLDIEFLLQEQQLALKRSDEWLKLCHGSTPAASVALAGDEHHQHDNQYEQKQQAQGDTPQDGF
jgi:hypothetical protein